MSADAPQFGTRGWSVSADGRLDAPPFHRNCEPIGSVLAPLLEGAESADVLEVGSGTGQHAAAYARRFPAIIWWPSDYDEAHLRSIAAWRREAKLANLRPPVRLDLSVAWWDALAAAGCPAVYRVIFCANVLHIAPWEVSQGLFAGAARLLAPDGRLLIYGPFMRGRAHTAPSNAAFDRSLRMQNAAWGLRDIEDLATLAAGVGLQLDETHAMPANNLILVIGRSRNEGVEPRSETA
jgi:SAM-dependent methyltransferase